MPEKDIFYFHSDHLGSSSYITTVNGQISQHVEYIAFGEVLFEEHASSFKTPYLYNGKELDRETNLSYYGARYLDMKTSLWLNVDPLAEIAPNKSPYHFCSNNPVNRIDPTGLTDYTVNGETRTINDGHNDVTMKVSEKQFDKLQNKFDKGGARYERYMNRLSVKNGFTTSSLYADSEASSGVGISLTQHKAGGDSYSDWSLNNTISEKLTKGNDIAGALLDASFNGNSAAGVLSKQAGYQLSAYKLGVAIQNDKQTYGYQSQVATGQVVGGIAGGATGAYIGQEIGGWIGGGIGFLCGGMGAIPGVLIGKAVGGAVGAYFGSDYGSDVGKEAAIRIGEKIEK